MLSLLSTQASFCDPPPLTEPVCEDPDDDKFLACGLEARVACIVSGDRHLLNVDGYAVLSIDDDSNTVELNRELLATQFEFDEGIGD